jgi:hypothetical protein
VKNSEETPETYVRARADFRSYFTVKVSCMDCVVELDFAVTVMRRL